MAARELPEAESLNYWKSGRGSPDGWIAKARTQLDRAGGLWLGEAFISTPEGAKFVVSFELEDQLYRIEWPVLPSSEELAARRQAATMIYHDVKAMCVKARVFGFRVAFLSHLVLPNGRTAASAPASKIAGLLAPPANL